MSSFFDHSFFCTIFLYRFFFGPFLFCTIFFCTNSFLHRFFFGPFLSHTAGQSGVSGRMDELRVSTSCSLTHLYHLRFFFDPPTPSESVLFRPSTTIFNFFRIMTDHRQFFVDPSPLIWVHHHHYRVWPSPFLPETFPQTTNFLTEPGKKIAAIAGT